MLLLVNGIKKEQLSIDFLELANITSIYKQKGEKSNLDNYRGIFILMIVRSILEKMIYNDNYETIDRNMSESNVGARRGRNIRDHLFVMNGVINDIYNGKGEDAHISVYDIVKCFDKMWLNEVMNDLYDSNMKSDQLTLLHEMNKISKVSI